MDSLCHPWFTTTNLSYRFPIFETSATSLVRYYWYITHYFITNHTLGILNVSVEQCSGTLRHFMEYWSVNQKIPEWMIIPYNTYPTNKEYSFSIVPHEQSIVNHVPIFPWCLPIKANQLILNIIGIPLNPIGKPMKVSGHQHYLW